MSDFKAKMHQIHFKFAFHCSSAQTRWGAYSTPADPIAVGLFKGLTSKERDGKKREGDGKLKWKE